jgi:hypothetical protein
MWQPIAKNQLTEVLIAGYENSIFVARLLENGLVVHAPRIIVNGEHIVPLAAQPMGDDRSRAFIHEETHLRRLHRQRHEGHIFQGFAGKQQTGPNVVRGQALVFFQNLIHRISVSQSIEDVVNR